MYHNAVNSALSVRGAAPETPGFAGIGLLQYGSTKKAKDIYTSKALINDILSVSYGLFLQGRTPALPLLLQSYRGKDNGSQPNMQVVEKHKIASCTTDVGRKMKG